jgi:hypothetical protein
VYAEKPPGCGKAATATQDRPAGKARMDQASSISVNHLRQIIFWPLQLMPLSPEAQIHRHWTLLEQDPDTPWQRVCDEFTHDPGDFQERHYIEFITFLPYVQRLLYGEGGGHGESPIQVFRRNDVKQIRIRLPKEAEPLLLSVAHVDLYFFYDLDIVILALEFFCDNLSLPRAQDVMFRFGRAYPHFWDATGYPSHCLSQVEWLDRDGHVLAASDYEDRSAYLQFVCRERTPRISSHWHFLLSPLVLHYSDQPGALRFRQLEYHRMPLMAYLAVDDMGKLTRADYVRLGLVTAPGDPTSLPYAAGYLEDFERRYCYDRFHDGREISDPRDTRIICCGHAFVMVGSSANPFFVDGEIGLLSQFRHQYFIIGLIAFMHKAALLMLRDRLVGSVNRLDIGDRESSRRFKREIRDTLEIFLRFTHRYWFEEISIQMQARDLFHRWREHLNTVKLFNEVREEIEDMGEYLSGENFRRQADTVLRLTVVTVFGLIGTFATGILGMNIFDETEQSWTAKVLIFLAVVIPAALIILLTVLKSRRLADALDILSNDRMPWPRKRRALAQLWSGARQQPRRRKGGG